jgi:hypothetical protein
VRSYKPDKFKTKFILIKIDRNKIIQLILN